MRPPQTFYDKTYYAEKEWGPAYFEWVQRNPLRRWRHSQLWTDDSRTVIRPGAPTEKDWRRILGVWPDSMYAAERGEYLPPESRLADLAVRTGVPDLADQWAAWLRDFPREIPLDGPDAPRLSVGIRHLHQVLRAV